MKITGILKENNPIKENLRFASCFFILFLLSGCISSQKTLKEERIADHSFYTKRLKTRFSMIPFSSATHVMPLSELKKQTADTIYRKTSGQASAIINWRSDTLYITASCDSLQALVYEYETSVSRLMAEQSEIVQEKEKKGTRWTNWLFVIPLFLLIVWVRKGA